MSTIEAGKGRTADKLRSYLRAADQCALDVRATASIPLVFKSFEAADLRLHLLTGGQRIEQFVRLKWADVGDEALTIFDGKGRPGQGPRGHHIPLIKLARGRSISSEAPGRVRDLDDRGKEVARRADAGGLGSRCGR